MRSTTLLCLALSLIACAESGPPPFGATIDLADATAPPLDEGVLAGDAADDAAATRPVLLEADPPQSVYVGGAQPIAFTWRAEAGLADVQAWALPTPDAEEGQPLAVLDHDAATWRFELPVDEAPGQTVWVRVQATDAAGGVARRGLQWTAGELLAGLVVPGPGNAMDVLVEREGEGDRAWRPLASTTTDARGRFRLVLPPGLGPLRLTATGTPASRLLDAAGRASAWGRAHLRTVLPAAREDRPALVSPWGDLAYALALADSLAHGGRLAERHAPLLAALSAHFGLRSPDGLVFGPAGDPRDLDAPTADEDTRARTLALRCFLGASATLGPVQLIERLRDDAQDGQMTGRFVAEDAPADPLRRDLAAGCDLPVDAVPALLPWLNALIHNEDPLLFGPEGGRPTDDAADPELTLALREEAGRLAPLPGGAWVVTGPILLRAEGADDRPDSGSIEAAVDGDDRSDALRVVEEAWPSPYRRGATFRFDPAGLAQRDGDAVQISVRLTDAAGRTTTRTVDVVLARAPLAPSVRPLGDVRATSATTWHTRSAEAETVAAEVTPGLIAQVELLVDGAPVPALRGPGAQQRFSLPLGGWEEGSYALTWRAVDVFGRGSITTRDLIVDRTAPQAAWLTTTYLDEGAAVVDLTPDGPVIRLTPQAVEVGPAAPQPIPVRKLRDRLGADDPNLPTLRWRVEDAGGVEDVRVELDDGAPLQRGEAGEWALPITGPLTGFGPGTRPGARWPAVARHVVLTDAAGNVARLAIPTFVAALVAPPLHVAAEVQAPLRDARAPATFADVARPDGRHLVGRWRITNPWPEDRVVRVDPAAPLQMVASTALRPGGGPTDVLGPGVREGDALVFRRAGQIDRYVRPGCLGEDDRQLAEAAELIEGPLDALRYQIRVYRCLERRGEGPLTGEAPVELRWEGPAPDRAPGGVRIGAGEAFTLTASVDALELRDSHPELLTQLTGQAAGLDHAVFLDADDRARYLLFQRQACVLGQPCERGYWLTRRVRALTGLRLTRGPVQLVTRVDGEDQPLVVAAEPQTWALTP